MQVATLFVLVTADHTFKTSRLTFSFCHHVMTAGSLFT